MSLWTSSAPWWPCFSTNRKYLNNLVKGCPKEHLCKIIFKSGQYFWTRRFLKFKQCTYKENKLWPLAAMFFNGLEIFEQSWQRVPQGTFVQKNFQIGLILLDKKIFKVLTMHIYVKQDPPPGGHVFNWSEIFEQYW